MSSHVAAVETKERRKTQFGVWTVEGHWPVIRYRWDVIEGIRLRVTDSFLSIPRGGLELGGVLLGTIDGNTVTIEAHREFQIEYLSGPSFILSQTDRERLAVFIAGLHKDPELANFEVVGWYHSHTRSEMFLSEEDIGIYNEFFPDAHQVALVVKPFKFDPAQFGFFFREQDGSLNSASSYAVFAAGPTARDAMAADEEPRTASPVRMEPADVPVNGQPLPVQPFPDAVPYRSLRSRRRHHQRWAVAAAALLFAALASLLWFGGSPTIPDEPAAALSMRLSGSGEQINIIWDGSSVPVQNAAYGELNIFDDGHQSANLKLSPQELTRGTATYVRQSGNVEVRMRIVADGSPIEEVAYFVGPEPERNRAGAPPEVSREERAKMATMQAEIERLNAQINRIQPAGRLAASAPVPDVTRPPAPQPATSVPARRIAAPPPSSARRELESAPMLAPTPDLRVTGTVPQGPIMRTPAVAGVAPPVTPPVVRATRRSGRAIWTGTLSKGNFLLLDATRPSVGALTGEMFDGPSRIRIYPAELADGGIQVFTMDDRHRERPVVEPPSSRNGWNLTSYVLDPRRSRALTLVEGAGPQNGWRRLLVRNDGRPISMIIIDWASVPE